MVLRLDRLHGEPKITKHVIRLPNRFAAAELLVWKNAASQMTECDADDGLWRIVIFIADKFVAGWRTKGMLDLGIQVLKCEQYVLIRESFGDGFRHLLLSRENPRLCRGTGSV